MDVFNYQKQYTLRNLETQFNNGINQLVPQE